MRMDWAFRLPVACGIALFLMWPDPGSARSECDRDGVRRNDGSAVCVTKAEAGCGTADSCDSWISVSSAMYGSADYWCSGLGWVARICNGRDACTVTLPDIGTQWSSAAEYEHLSEELICGSLNKVRKLLYIGWYCSDGVTAFGQPEVVIGDGGRARLSCNGR